MKNKEPISQEFNNLHEQEAASSLGLIRGRIQTGCISGYTGHMPGSEQAFGINWGIQKKITAGLMTSKREARVKSSLPLDKWGNTKVNNPRVKSELAAMYLNVGNPNDTLSSEGAGSPGSAGSPDKAPKLPSIKNPVLAECARPFKQRKERNVPNRIVGYSGHRPGNNDSVGQCVNIEYFAEQSMEGYVPPPAADSTTMNSSNIYRLG
eukprot:CAMPEP_0174281306 /NCGR_PEP_ID=MMETSP0809-20121228/1679_1 /TAXON_ID=73025 ORGANISM="Eutreptiella gymnastica-like, Strain CCMP1594" /NCGR_SAMPLE_ID=MMETSP0809 /ASSEMBLY_ACC=CAM_ASM_000658 /LENGTH=207 /DNA_ID=CAMNT_0015374771 /DNA_START=69 /DNA_END=692 /DNA_ORIENTATION=+